MSSFKHLVDDDVDVEPFDGGDHAYLITIFVVALLGFVAGFVLALFVL